MNEKKIIVLYGLPCSGKSQLVKSLSNFYSILIDTLIVQRIKDPTIDDFNVLSIKLIDDIISEVKCCNSTEIVIEMGCLIPRASTERLETYFQDNNINYLNIILTAQKEELVRRIEKRNRNIDLGHEKGIKVHGPDYLTRFSEVFDVNQPKSRISIDTSSKPVSELILEIKTLIKST